MIENALTSEERYEVAKSLATHLAPHVSITAIQQKSIYYRIIKELMDERIILDWLGYPLAQQFYSDLLPYYDWDARYWEQRALAEARMGHLDKAMSFAETAVERNRDPFTLNTLGTILLRIAASAEYREVAGTPSLYWKGVNNLHESAEKGRGLFPHPYTTFFSHTLRYATAQFVGQEIPREIIKEWDLWYDRAQRSALFASPEKFEILTKYKVSWLKLATENRGT